MCYLARMKIDIPQIIYLVMIFVGLFESAAKSNTKEFLLDVFFVTAFSGLLYWGGFF